MTKFNELANFVDIAVKSRKYQPSTAQGLKSALKLFEAELTNEEKESLDLFKNNFEQIYRIVSSKNNKTFTAASLATYRSRVVKVLGDYEKYGIDTTKMASWVPKPIERSKKTSLKSAAVETNNDEIGDSDSVAGGSDMHRIELALRPNFHKFVLVVPRDITHDESEMLKSILGSLSGEGRANENSKIQNATGDEAR